MIISNVTDAQKLGTNCHNFLESLAKGLQRVKSKFLTTICLLVMTNNLLRS